MAINWDKARQSARDYDERIRNTTAYRAPKPTEPPEPAQPINPLAGMIDPAVGQARAADEQMQVARKQQTQQAQDDLLKAYFPFDYNADKRGDQSSVDMLERQLEEKKAKAADLQKRIAAAVDWPTLANGDPLPAFVELQKQSQAADLEVAEAQAQHDKTRNDLYENKHNLKQQDLESVSYTDKDFATKAQDTANIPFSDKYDQLQDFIKYTFDPETKAAVANTAGLSGSGALEQQYAPLDYLAPDEKATLLYYSRSGDWAKTKEYFDIIMPSLQERHKAGDKKFLGDLSHDNPLVGTVINAASAIQQPLAAVGILAQNIENRITGEYKPVNRNTEFFTGAQNVQTTTEGITRDMSGLGKIAAQIGLSLNQYIATIPLGPTAALAYMSMSAAGAAGYDALERGATPEQALNVALVAGAAEALTEKIPFDNFFKIFTSGSKETVKEALLTIAKQAGQEGLEELVSQYVNTIADNAIMADKSHLAGLIRSYTEQGMTQDEATRKALVETYITNPAIAAAGGIVTGGALSSTGTIGPLQSTVQGKQVINADAVADLEEQGLESADDTESYRLVTAMQEKLDAGKKVTAAKVGQLIANNDKLINQPYTSKKPLSVQTAPEVTIDQSSLDLAREHIEDAKFRKDFVESKDTFKNGLMMIYKSSGNARKVAVDGGVDGKTYNVTIDKSTAEHVIKDIEAASSTKVAGAPNVSAEKLVVLQNIDAIVKNSAYVESGKVTAKSGGKRQTVQHDYFEVPVTIAGEKYIARFDVAVKKAQNVVNGIEIEKARETGTSPDIIPSSIRNRSADDVSRAYIYQMRQMQSSKTTENNAHKLDIGTRVGYDGSVKMVTTEGAGDVSRYFKDEQLETEPNMAYFWSGNSNGIGGKDFAMDYAAQNGGTTLEGLMKSQGIKMPTWDIADQNSIKVWEYASRKYAKQVSGEVHALIGTTQRPNSIWRSIELQELMKNPCISKIILVDPETLTETVIFRRYV